MEIQLGKKIDDGRTRFIGTCKTCNWFSSRTAVTEYAAIIKLRLSHRKNCPLCKNKILVL